MAGNPSYVPGLVSVVIPAYNAAPYIVQAVQSALNQTYPHIDCIVVDDGSTDDTRERLQPYMDRIHYIWQENQERSAARNRGIEIARGEHIAFLDADDWWHREKVAKQLRALHEYPSAGLAYTWMRSVSASGEMMDIVADQESGLLKKSVIFPKLFLGKHLTGAGSTMMVRRKCIEHLGRFDPCFTGPEDWEFPMRIALEYDLVCVAEPLAFYRRISFDLFHILRNRKIVEQHSAILNKIMHLLPPDSQCRSLYPRALADVLWHGALVHYGVGEIEQARSYAMQAYHRDRGYFGQTTGSALQRLVGVTTYFRYFPVYWPRAERFLTTVFHDLSQEIPESTWLCRKARANLYERAFYDAWARGTMDVARTQGAKAIRHNARLVLNRGFLKRFIVAWAKLL